MQINGFIIVFLCTVTQLNMIVCTEGEQSSEGCDPACFEDQICDVENNKCIVNTSDSAGPFIVAKRSAPCQGVICAIACYYGFQNDENGCPICRCNEQDQCPFMFCPSGKCFRSRCIDKPGVCPPPFPVGACVEDCSGDYSCPGEQKCCYHGCGHSCRQPMPLVGDPLEVCPLLKKSKACIRVCPTGSDCAGGRKCCQRCCKRGGCGGVCVEPLRCTVNKSWRGTFKFKKTICQRCRCEDMVSKGEKFMERACKKPKVFNNCCPFCQFLQKK